MESDVERYLRFLERFASTKNQPREQAEAAQEGIAASNVRGADTPNDYPTHVHTAFHAVVQHYSRCACAVAPLGAMNHEARLKLRETIKVKDDDFVFDTVFSRNPTGQEAPVEWQHLQFRVLRYNTNPTHKQFPGLSLT